MSCFPGNNCCAKCRSQKPVVVDAVLEPEGFGAVQTGFGAAPDPNVADIVSNLPPLQVLVDAAKAGQAPSPTVVSNADAALTQIGGDAYRLLGYQQPSDRVSVLATASMVAGGVLAGVILGKMLQRRRS